jgi:Calx-beta domain-containing protein
MNASTLRRPGAAAVAVALMFGLVQAPAGAAPKTSISIADAAVIEGDTGSKQMVFTVRAKGPGTSRASVSWATTGATAIEGADFTDDSGTVSFASGKTQTVRIAVLGDLIDEPTETFHVLLGGAVNARITDSQALGTITDNDDAPVVPVVSVSDDVVGEGNALTSAPASFEVTLSEPAASPVSLTYSTENGTATAGSDYAASGGTRTFSPGQTSKTIVVDVLGDDVAAEGNENFAVNISAPVGATISDGIGVGTIIDDEVSPAVSIGDATVTEGVDATAVFPVSLSHASAQEITVDYQAVSGSASETLDFEAASGTVQFPAGTMTRNVVVGLADDTIDEPSESFTVSLSNHPGALAADVEGRGVIKDNETAPRVVVDNATLREGVSPTAAVRISLSHGSSEDVKVEYAAADGSAKVTKDYSASSGVATFTSGDLRETVAVPVLNDAVAEWRESFAFDVTTTLNADLGDGAATVTILDDDRKPSYTKVRTRVKEGRIIVAGRLSPAHKGRRMTVTLKKRSHGRWVKVRTKHPLLSKGIDVNNDGVLDSKYTTRFFNPRNTMRCRIIARFRGDVHHFPSTARRTFPC